MNELRERYEREAVPQLMKAFGYKSIMEVPKVEKVTINVGLGEALQNPKALDAAAADLATITGQKPVITKAKKSVAAFKVRTGMSIGAKVTLRGDRMYDFLNKLFHVALPRVRDFKGLSSRGLDGRGNYTLGMKEQVVFPEIDYDKVDKVRGMNITITTTAKTDEEGKALLAGLGMPFRD